MKAIDTNVLVRLIARDDPRQTKAAEEFVSGGAWVSWLALAEATWVLATVYNAGPRPLAEAIGMLLDHRTLVIQDAEVVAAALARFRAKPALGFSDCMMLELARRAGHLPLGTFDRRLAGVEGAERI